MDPIEGLKLGFGLALTPQNLLFAFVGCLVGTVPSTLTATRQPALRFGAGPPMQVIGATRF